jgi:general secretion pathway protein J|tara:strand:+ start:200 stop:811 length:612 start_codon:yes stop_codon:yes gene_type:complete
MKSQGFTLIEVLVSISLVALIGVMSIGGLNTTINSNDKTLERSSLIKSIIQADSIIKRDLLHAINRLSVNENGDRQLHSFTGVNKNGDGVIISLNLHIPFYGLSEKGAIRRVDYFLEDQKLKRIEYDFSDITLSTKSTTSEILSNVSNIQIKFQLNNELVDNWPITDWTSNNGLPKVLELSIDIKNLGLIKRRYMLPVGVDDV